MKGKKLVKRTYQKWLGIILASKRNYIAVVIQLKCNQLRNQFPPDRITGVNGSVLFAADASLLCAISSASSPS